MVTSQWNCNGDYTTTSQQEQRIAEQNLTLDPRFAAPKQDMHKCIEVRSPPRRYMPDLELQCSHGSEGKGAAWMTSQSDQGCGQQQPAMAEAV